MCKQNLRIICCVLVAVLAINWTGFEGHEVKARQLVSATFTAFPQPMQVYPRDLNTNQAIIPITGEVTTSGQDEIIVRIYRDAVLADTLTQPLAYSASVAPFAFSPTIPAETNNYRFEVYAKEGDVETLVAVADEVVAGDIYIINGQSNALAADGSGLNPAGPLQSPFIRSFGWRDTIENGALILADTNWYMAEGTKSAGTGEIGLWGLLMARRLLDMYDIPIAIINGAQGGKPIQFFQRDDVNPYDSTTNYGILYWRAQMAGVVDGVRAIFWYQGESDGGSVATYQSEFDTLYQGWHTDYPNIKRVFVHQVRNGCGPPPPSVELRDLQRRFGDIYSDVKVMSTNGATQASDLCHYRFINGYEVIGEQIYPLVARELYGAPDSLNIDAPNIRHAYFSNTTKTEVTLVMRDQDDALTWETGVEGDLRLEGSTVAVTGGAVDGNEIVLTLSGDGSSATGITYDSPAGEGKWVRNGKGIGMMDFYNIAIEDTKPIITPLYLPLIIR